MGVVWLGCLVEMWLYSQTSIFSISSFVQMNSRHQVQFGKNIGVFIGTFYFHLEILLLMREVGKNINLHR